MCLSVCLYVAYHYENVLPMQYTEIFLALKIEEKNISDCQILETKSSNIVYLILPCIRHYIKVGFNGIYVKANVQLSCKLTKVEAHPRRY